MITTVWHFQSLPSYDTTGKFNANGTTRVQLEIRLVLKNT